MPVKFSKKEGPHSLALGGAHAPGQRILSLFDHGPWKLARSTMLGSGQGAVDLVPSSRISCAVVLCQRQAMATLATYPVDVTGELYQSTSIRPTATIRLV